ncbi:MAG: hypothetical protein R3C10_20450 [Pirellulales bacterium]
MTLIQNARTSGGGNVVGVPTQAITVGPQETWRAEKVSIWQAGCHDNPLGMRLTTLMISQQIPDSSVPMSLLADHPNVQFNFLPSRRRQLRDRDALGSAAPADGQVVGRIDPHATHHPTSIRRGTTWQWLELV